MALTAPQEADIEESLSKVTELGRFCTITCTDDNDHSFKDKVSKKLPEASRPEAPQPAEEVFAVV